MYRVRTGQELRAMAIALPRFQSVLLGSFAGIALVLTAVGAARRDVLGMVLREAMQLVGLGLTLGLAGAVAAQRLLGSMLFGVRPGDPIFVTVACFVVVITSLAAAYVPAARAASVDPMQSLRTE
jgi:ABC-type antimicrobial peptide transport system permease subunit